MFEHKGSTVNKGFRARSPLNPGTSKQCVNETHLTAKVIDDAIPRHPGSLNEKVKTASSFPARYKNVSYNIYRKYYIRFYKKKYRRSKKKNMKEQILGLILMFSQRQCKQDDIMFKGKLIKCCKIHLK